MRFGTRLRAGESAAARLPKRDKLFFYSLIPFAVLVAAVFILLFKVLIDYSMPIFEKEGVRVLTSTAWRPSETNPQLEFYGLLPAIVGTFYASAIALALALPASLALTVFIEEIVPLRLRSLVTNLVEVMAGLPTIIYGLWGAYVLAPLLHRYVMVPVHNLLAFIPLFSCEPITAYTIFTAGVILAIMITPFVTSIIREAYEAIPFTYREAALSLGITQFEYVRIMLGLIRPAVVAALLLGFGRAAGETVAVALTIGNSFTLTACMFSPGYTIPSLIANQFGNANYYKYMLSALYAGSLVLLVAGLVINSIGLYYLLRWRRWIGHG